jgi:hypothetical protein
MPKNFQMSPPKAGDVHVHVYTIVPLTRTTPNGIAAGLNMNWTDLLVSLSLYFYSVWKIKRVVPNLGKVLSERSTALPAH